MPKRLRVNYESIGEATQALPEWLRTTPSPDLSPLLRIEKWQHDPAVIGRRVRERREAAGMSLRSMAKWMSISAAHLSDMELGKKPWAVSRLEDATHILELAERSN